MSRQAPLPRSHSPISRPTTPLRPSSRSSFRQSTTRNHAVMDTGSLDALEPQFSELADSLADLEANMANLALVGESLGRFGENFASFLYGLEMGAFVVDFPEAPLPESISRYNRRQRNQARQQNPDATSFDDNTILQSSNTPGDSQFSTTNNAASDATFMDTSLASLKATPRRKSMAPPMTPATGPSQSTVSTARRGTGIPARGGAGRGGRGGSTGSGIFMKIGGKTACSHTTFSPIVEILSYAVSIDNHHPQLSTTYTEHTSLPSQFVRASTLPLTLHPVNYNSHHITTHRATTMSNLNIRLPDFSSQRGALIINVCRVAVLRWAKAKITARLAYIRGILAADGTYALMQGNHARYVAWDHLVDAGLEHADGVLQACASLFAWLGTEITSANGREWFRTAGYLAGVVTGLVASQEDVMTEALFQQLPVQLFA